MEIGTGRGVLTAELCKLSDRVVAYEIDEENFQLTKNMLEGLTCKLHLGDAFRSKFNFDVLVASLPYSRSSTFVEWLSQRTYRRAVVVLQKDFVGKIRANPGEEGYRAISVIAQLSFRMRTAVMVGPESFEPPPRVNSTIVVFEPKKRLTDREISLIKRLFSLKNKKLTRILKILGMERVRIPEQERDMRPRSMAVDDLSEILVAMMQYRHHVSYGKYYGTHCLKQKAHNLDD
jgi:16S rRNA A1518/A1519 N6-dimethyltransferase RsmA/KsgA/DIM1 with predicted DNA glycosylase/AP lyase activity